MADRSGVGKRGYKLGERDPNTLPGGRAGTETPDENKRNTIYWRKVMAWAIKPGGKYHA